MDERQYCLHRVRFGCEDCKFLSLQQRLAAAEKRIKDMYIDDLSPESRLAGYVVLVEKLEKRRDSLIATGEREKGLRQFKDIATEMYPTRMLRVSGACDFANEQASAEQKPPDDTTGEEKP